MEGRCGRLSYESAIMSITEMKERRETLEAKRQSVASIVFGIIEGLDTCSSLEEKQALQSKYQSHMMNISCIEGDISNLSTSINIYQKDIEEYELFKRSCCTYVPNLHIIGFKVSDIPSNIPKLTAEDIPRLCPSISVTSTLVPDNYVVDALRYSKKMIMSDLL